MRQKIKKRPSRIIGYIDKIFPVLNRVSLLEIKPDVVKNFYHSIVNVDAELVLLETCPHKLTKKKIYRGVPVGKLVAVGDNLHQLVYEFDRMDVVNYYNARIGDKYNV